MRSSRSLPLQAVQPENWPQPSGYANALRVPAGRDLLFLAGQIGWDSTQQLVSPDFVPQFEQALRNCATLVESAGGAVGDIVRMTVFCSDKQDYLGQLEQVGQAWRRVMGRHYPAMSLVQVAALVEDGARVELEATAAVPPCPAPTGAAPAEAD